MLPVGETAKGKRRLFDEILVSDFRTPGAIRVRNIAHIEEQRRLGRRVGLIQMARYDFEANADIQPAFNDLEARGVAQFIVFGEHVTCERLVVLHAPVLEEFQRFVPDVEAKKVEVRVPLIDTPLGLTRSEALRDWLEVCQRNAERYFGDRGEWICYNSKVDAALRKREHASEECVEGYTPADGY